MACSHPQSPVSGKTCGVSRAVCSSVLPGGHGLALVAQARSREWDEVVAF